MVGKKLFNEEGNIIKKHGTFNYTFTPDGKKLRSNCEIEQFVEDHPDVKCDMEVTNTFNI